jgi:hypothetical protein
MAVVLFVAAQTLFRSEKKWQGKRRATLLSHLELEGAR